MELVPIHATIFCVCFSRSHGRYRDSFIGSDEEDLSSDSDLDDSDIGNEPSWPPLKVVDLDDDNNQDKPNVCSFFLFYCNRFKSHPLSNQIALSS